MTNKLSSIVIKETDNVATALAEFKAGQVVTVSIGDEVRKLALKSDIRFLHKFALEDIKKNQCLYQYGYATKFGGATEAIGCISSCRHCGAKPAQSRSYRAGAGQEPAQERSGGSSPGSAGSEQPSVPGRCPEP